MSFKIDNQQKRWQNKAREISYSVKCTVQPKKHAPNAPTAKNKTKLTVGLPVPLRKLDLDVEIGRDRLHLAPLRAHHRTMMSLRYDALDRDHRLQIGDDLQYPRLGRLDVVLGALQDDLVALDARTRERDDHAAALVADAVRDFAATRHEVLVVAGIHRHLAFGDVVLRKSQDMN